MVTCLKKLTEGNYHKVEASFRDLTSCILYSVDVLYRSDFFPGLGWMLTRTTWDELSPKWPKAYPCSKFASSFETVHDLILGMRKYLVSLTRVYLLG